MPPNPRPFFFLALFLLLSWVPSAQSGVVYLVVGSDTAIWNDGSTVDVYARHPYYPQDFFTDPLSPAYQVMDPAWRNAFKDCFGQPIKFTWWLMGGNIYRDAVNQNVPVPNTMVPYLMKKYHGDALRQFGDELSLHYHTFFWSDYNGDGLFYWNQSQSFEECRQDFDYTLSQYLLEEQIFPVSFRSGWHYMDNAWQQYLDELLPFSMHNNWPYYRLWYTNEPIGNVQDWSRAPSALVPYHPSTNDYQVPGSCQGWNVRSIKMQSMSQAVMDYIFAQAMTGGDQIVCIWNHLPEAFVPNFVRIDSFAQISATNYPAVRFRYCTAIEGMQHWLGTPDTTPPQLEVSEAINDQVLSLTLTSSEPIFQPRPFLALRDVFGRYTNLTWSCQPHGSNVWLASLPLERKYIAKIGIAVTDLAGNLTTRILRYFPDDFFLDNLDPQYSEISGDWRSTTNFAWGTDARIASLTSNSVARVRWELPITQSGAYRLSVQIPAVTNAATNLFFDVHADNAIIYSKNVPLVPGKQWLYLGAPVLEATRTNFLEMTIDGTNQPGALAVADVLRVVPTGGASNGAPLAVQLTITRASDGILVRFPGEPFRTYELQRSAQPGPFWDTVETLEVPPFGIVEYKDTNALPGTAFYRVQSY